MPLSKARAFTPQFVIDASVASALMRIEAARHAVESLPITPTVLATLRETAKLQSTHYSTAIEGNRLTAEEVARVVGGRGGRLPGRERDEKEVKGYYAAMAEVERLVDKGGPITEKVIGILHARVMGGARATRPTSYRAGQNVIRDSASGRIVYMPPEAKDVPILMKALVEWIDRSELPPPLTAGIAHYQFATIHPWYDGNGRVARLLATLVLHLGGYGLKGLYALEEYYAQDLQSYYQALSLGPSHNYYMGRAEADITRWVEYFTQGVSASFAKVQERAAEAARQGKKDASAALRALGPRQRRVLDLFRNHDEITAGDIERLFGIKPRTARAWCSAWMEDGFLAVAKAARKIRTYRLAARYLALSQGPP